MIRKTQELLFRQFQCVVKQGLFKKKKTEVEML